MFYGNNQGISSDEIVVGLNFDHSLKCCKRMGNSRPMATEFMGCETSYKLMSIGKKSDVYDVSHLGHRRCFSSYFEQRLYINVYRKKSDVSLIILSSVFPIYEHPVFILFLISIN